MFAQDNLVSIAIVKAGGKGCPTLNVEKMGKNLYNAAGGAIGLQTRHERTRQDAEKKPTHKRELALTGKNSTPFHVNLPSGPSLDTLINDCNYDLELKDAPQ
jgi:hypothetical protein